MQKNNPSIKSIAEEAGVSIATVSRVLNTPDKVNPQMRARVEQAIARNNYRPNPSAQVIRRKSSGIYGALFPHYRTESFTRILAGAIAEAALTGRSIIPSVPYDNLEEERDAIANLIDKPLDGLIYLPRSTGYAIPKIDYFKDIPIVGISRRHIAFETACVYSDNVRSGYLATQYLLKLGRTSLAFVAAVQPGSGIRTVEDLERTAGQEDAGAYVAADRWRGYRAALQEAGVPYTQERVVIGEFSKHGGFESGQRILCIPGGVDGVVAGSDMTAMGIVSVLQSQGISVPESVSIVGCNDDSLASLCRPGLTTIRHESGELGRQAIRMLNDLTEGLRVENRMIDVSLVVRDSTVAKGT